MPPDPMTPRNSNCRNCKGIMMGCPHLLQGTVPSGGRSPGMNTFVSHQLQVTMRSCSLMLEINLAPPGRSTSLETKGRRGKFFDKCPEMVSLTVVENENHVGFNSEAAAGPWAHVQHAHLAA